MSGMQVRPTNTALCDGVSSLLTGRDFACPQIISSSKESDKE